MGKDGFRGNVGPKSKPCKGAESTLVLVLLMGFLPTAVSIMGGVPAVSPQRGPDIEHMLRSEVTPSCRCVLRPDA